MVSKNFGVTEQYLEAHELIYEDDQPMIAHISRNDEKGTASVYFPVKGEKFFFVVYLQTSPTAKVISVNDQSHHRVYFTANSEVLDFEGLSALTTLTPTGGWNKGDPRKFGKNRPRTFSRIDFMPSPEPGDFDTKLDKLLDFLEQDVEGVKRLVKEAYGHINVATIFYNKNTMLGGFRLTSQTIARLHALNLTIDFDLYAEGNYIK